MSPRRLKRNLKDVTAPTKWHAVAIPREMARLTSGWWRHASFGIPLNLLKSAVREPSFVSWSDHKVYGIVGDAVLNVIDSWGPLYGKAMQILLSRVGPRGQSAIEKLNLDRVYSDWPAMPWEEVQLILDRQIPLWRDRLKLESHPLGVASLSQVHAAEDHHGKKWVVKILKPKAAERLAESITALESALIVAEPFALTKLAKRFLKDMSSMCLGLRQEMNLLHERETMRRVRELLIEKKSQAIRVPKSWDELSTDCVIVMERLVGIKLSDVVAGRAELSASERRHLARKILNELLVQIFEWGLFHGDPHAGNLMLLDDGSVGLYDWGLAGELLESDRHYIAGILRAVMGMDMEKLIDVLQQMGEDTKGETINREKIRKELQKISDLTKKAREGANSAPPSLHTLIDGALQAADKLGIVMPHGLLLMAKSLLTIEGLAKGIDEDVAFARVAGPVLFRAASPQFSDVFNLIKQVPKLAGKWFKNR